MSMPLTTPVTTAQQPNTRITTTTVNPTSSSQIPPPALRTRPAGWHAKSFGFDWNKRSDQHKYLVKSGLPEVHAAIMNDDWDLALELIGPDDFGLLWLPPASQRLPQNSKSDLEASSWTIDLLNKNEDIQNNAILEMALHNTFVTSAGNNCLYGANLLTLCLLKPARPNILQHVISLAARQAPQYLNLPDALGRSPLWVAIENQDHASMHLLLKAGANPLQACKFSDKGEPKSHFSLAAKYANKEIFRDLLLATLEQVESISPYEDFGADPLCLKIWASVHSSEDVLWLADQVEALRGPLLCCKDKSGSSYFYRSIIDGSLGRKLKNGNEDLIEWLKSLDISTVVSDDIESSPLYAAASQATIHTYKNLTDFFFNRDKETSFNKEKQRLHFLVDDKFFIRWSVKDFDQYLEGLPEISEASKSKQKEGFIEGQLEAYKENYCELNFDEYANIVKSLWPFISSDNKNKIFIDAMLSTDESRELVLGLLDYELPSSTIECILQLAGPNRDTAAFEFAADRSLEMAQTIESIEAGNNNGYDMFRNALAARSMKWVERLLDAGFNLQIVIDEFPVSISILADIDHQGLAQKLKGLNYEVTPHMIERANTEAGKHALKALMNSSSNHV